MGKPRITQPLMGRPSRFGEPDSRAFRGLGGHNTRPKSIAAIPADLPGDTVAERIIAAREHLMGCGLAMCRDGD